MKKVLKGNWINRLIEGDNKKAEVVVSLSVQEVAEKLCLWGQCDGATTDVVFLLKMDKKSLQRCFLKMM